MGNESSTEIKTLTITEEELDSYHKKMCYLKEIIAQKDQRINKLVVELDITNKTSQAVHSRLLETLQTKEFMTNDHEARFNRERNNLYCKIENITRNLEEKDIEMRRKLSEANENKKTVTKELNKYKSMAEFQALMKLNVDLIDFQSKIESVVANDFDLLQTSDDNEIKMIKLKNTELFGRLKNNNVKTLIMEKSAKLKEIENELNSKKEIAKQEFLMINGKLMIIKEKMGEGTKKFAETFEKSIGDLQKKFQTYQKEVIALNESKKKINESLSHVGIKNILLEQQNMLMNEMIGSNHLNDNNNYQDNVIVDDIRGSNSIGKSKTFKVVLHNVHEDGNMSDDVKVQKVLRELTDFSLDDIAVRRLGKPTGKVRPIVVAFDSMDYVQDILKNRHLLKDTKFNMIGVSPYVSKSYVKRRGF